jgi:hypothetical protein
MQEALHTKSTGIGTDTDTDVNGKTDAQLITISNNAGFRLPISFSVTEIISSEVPENSPHRGLCYALKPRQIEQY